jgi:prevent-host-death family protein
MDNVAMKPQPRRVGVRELKDSLSAQLRRVAAGETIVVTDRGRDIVRLVPAALSPGLVELARRGTLILPSRPRRRARRPVPWRSGQPLASDIVVADRRR